MLFQMLTLSGEKPVNISPGLLALSILQESPHDKSTGAHHCDRALATQPKQQGSTQSTVQS